MCSCRLEEEDALRAKVDEALSVYDEYMKNKGEPEAPAAAAAAEPAKPEEAEKEAAAEETKA